MSKVIDYIRMIGPEFNSLPDDALEMWCEMVRPMVSKKQFGKLYEQAMAYLVCHKLKMAGHGANPLGELGKIGVGFAVGSVSEGGSSISFGANSSSNIATDAELGLTVYGIQYLQLRRMVIIPIHVGGEYAYAESSDKRDTAPSVPVASEDTLGAVRIRPGSGLVLDEDGSLRIETGSGE